MAGAAAIGVIAIAVSLAIGLPGSSQGAGTPAKPAGATTVQRRDLVATDTESGTLGYANQQTVYNRVSGTVTWLPAVGQVIKPGQTLYKVDNGPVVLFSGTTPAYRDLTSSDSAGPDILELNQNLVSLGFADGQIRVNSTWQTGTTDAIDRWQGSLGETETGTISLGQVVFLPGSQLITTVNTVLGSTGGAAGSASSTASGSGSSTGASTIVSPPRPEFVSLTTTTPTGSTSATGTTGTTGRSGTNGSSGGSRSGAGNGSNTGHGSSGSGGTKRGSGGGGTKGTGGRGTKKSPGGTSPGKSTSSEVKILLALLKAETLELEKSHSSLSSSGPSGAGGRSGGGASSSPASGGGGGGGGASTASTASSGGGASAAGGTGSSAQPILQTTSTKEVVTVNLGASKQSEAVVGAAVTVQLPDGTTADGKITQVSPVAQTSSSSSSGAAGAGGSTPPSSTVPVTITLTGHRSGAGLDQAAVSVNFEQQKATGVLSVPVTALLATAGGGYAVQQAAAPHRLVPVTPGLFAAGYVQISGAGIYPGLQVTDSQG